MQLAQLEYSVKTGKADADAEKQYAKHVKRTKDALAKAAKRARQKSR
jgi:hypothetical protein